MFYGTTSFQSEIPRTYLSSNFSELSQNQVLFSEGIKGALFLAKNCASKNNRESVVKQLSKSFRVDSLSSCLKNANAPPGSNIKDKKSVMPQYLFYLAFENQNTDDYITEKLWGSLQSGTIPVYLGAPDIKDHIPFNGVIFVKV